MLFFLYVNLGWRSGVESTYHQDCNYFRVNRRVLKGFDSDPFTWEVFFGGYHILGDCRLVSPVEICFSKKGMMIQRYISTKSGAGVLVDLGLFNENWTEPRFYDFYRPNGDSWPTLFVIQRGPSDPQKNMEFNAEMLTPRWHKVANPT